MPVALSDHQLEALAEIGGLVGSAAERAVVAVEVLRCLRTVVPYTAASVQAFNPITGGHETLANVGYPSGAVEHLDGWFVAHDEAYRFMRDVDPRPLRWHDMPFDYRRMFSASELWLPLGYREGVTVCLYDGSGRYTGNLHLNTDSVRYPSDTAMQVLRVLQSMLSGVVDVLRAPAWVARSLEAGAHAVFVTGSGHVLPLPGCPVGDHLETDAALPRIAASNARRGRASSFLWRDDAGLWHRVRIEPLSGGALVLESPTGLPKHLTQRELEVLTLIVEGCTNREIAAVFTVAVKTVAKHVEHLLEKLECTSRAGLAGKARADGLALHIETLVADHDSRSGLHCETAKISHMTY